MLLDQRGGDQRNHDFMVTGQRIAAPAGLRVRALHHIHARTVVLQEIEIHGGEIAQLVAQIAHAGDGLQKNLRHHDRRARVDVNAAIVQRGDQTAEQTEIVMRRAAQRCRIRRRMRVRRIGSDGDVHGHRHAGAPGLQQQTGCRRVLPVRAGRARGPALRPLPCPASSAAFHSRPVSSAAPKRPSGSTASTSSLVCPASAISKS